MDSPGTTSSDASAPWREVISRLCSPVEKPATLLWKAGFAVCSLLVLLLAASLVYVTAAGVGVLGVDNHVPWGWDIVNFVFWIGIGHAGTLISAILLLTRQQWRTSVNRIAEAMTLFAVLCAAVFPVFHMGRVWMAWFFVPVPESNGVWQNFLSPLMWDAFAVGTYFLLSLLFLYVCLVPDLALLRDRAGRGRRARFYGWLALGWIGTQRQWRLHRKMALILAGLLTPLVISVHSVVSYDFAATVVPGWHSTLFPPYFVAGAIFGGLAMVLLVVVPLRAAGRLKDMISPHHLESLAKLMLALSLVMGFCYGVEQFMAFYSGSPLERAAFIQRITGPFAWAFWAMLACNVVIPQCLWLRRVRRSTAALAGVALCVTLGMWLERFVIVAGTMSRSFMSASWSTYMPSWVDVAMFAGTFGLFFGAILLFIRLFPCVSIAEVCALRARGRVEIPSGAREAVSPFPVTEDDSEDDGPERDGIFRGTFWGASCGLLTGFLLTWATQLIDYPLILQGREADWSRFSGFVPVLFEMTILGAGLGTLVVFCREARLFRWWDPWFESPEYARYGSEPGLSVWPACRDAGEEAKAPESLS